ncbi:spondin domain-containing protein [Armatimonas sp.]|uniref:spondin domain-containing protein n=1 Tax=Armatimonas sp. TaxID=1872638 RepID=UPI0037512B1A
MFSTKIGRNIIGFGLLALVGIASPARAGLMAVTVTIQNLAPTNSISFAPLRLGFGNGTFDSFNIGTTAGAAIISIAEGGSGSDWFPAFALADPGSVRGSVGGALLPGATAANTFIVDTMSVNNRFFTFANMVIPSNDLFLGNDNPMAFPLFNPDGSLAITTITQTAGQIWDANSEIADALAAAFLVGGNNSARTPENGLIAFDRSELSTYNGLQTSAGYFFDSTLLPSNAQNIYRISFAVSSAPEPGSLLLVAAGIGLLGLKRRRTLK